MSEDWPLLLQYMSEVHGYQIRRVEAVLGYELYEVDLSAWRLSLSDRTPVIWIKSSDLASQSLAQVEESLQDIISERRLSRQVVIVLLDGVKVPLRLRARSPLIQPVFVDADDVQRIQHSRRPTGELLDLLTAQLPLTALAPYETRSPVSGSRFFGRDYEISRILANPDTNFAILGIRRIGKTSLLHEISRKLEEKQEAQPLETEYRGEQPVVYLDCSNLDSTGDFVRETVRKLNPKELTRLHLRDPLFFFPDFLERMRRMYHAKVIFLLDEIDNLLVKQRGNWDLFRMLRASSNRKACQFLIAGFREVLREQYDLDSPFFNFAEEIRLNEFTRRQAHELIVTPMGNLRVRLLHRDEVVARIYDETAGHPNLIQYYCAILLRRLDETNQREIGPDDLIDVYGDTGFRGNLVDSFLSNTQNREKALVYAVLAEIGERSGMGFSQEGMDQALQKRGIVLTHNELNDACNVLKLAGVLHQKGRDYSFISPVFARILQQTYDVGYLLRKVKEEGL